jgi:hypothetical protein
VTGAGLLPVVVYLMRQRIVSPPDSLFAVAHPAATFLLFAVVGAAAIVAYRTDSAV